MQSRRPPPVTSEPGTLPYTQAQHGGGCDPAIEILLPEAWQDDLADDAEVAGLHVSFFSSPQDADALRRVGDRSTVRGLHAAVLAAVNSPQRPCGLVYAA
jgi:hypothetical protein